MIFHSHHLDSVSQVREEQFIPETKILLKFKNTEINKQTKKVFFFLIGKEIHRNTILFTVL